MQLFFARIILLQSHENIDSTYRPHGSRKDRTQSPTGGTLRNMYHFRRFTTALCRFENRYGRPYPGTTATGTALLCRHTATDRLLTLFTIAADLTKMQVVADVDEADIAGVEEGARVTFTVDAYPDDVFEGVVRQVRLGSTNSTSSSSSTTTSTIVVTYEVVITADNPYLKLKPRLTANATIYTLTKDNVLTVPNKALRFTPNKDIVGGRKINDCQSSHKVWTLDNNTFTAHPVKIGITDGSKTEIVSGITENTPVVTETVVKGAMPGMEEPSAGEGERSPFMPGPPGSNKKKNK